MIQCCLPNYVTCARPVHAASCPVNRCDASEGNVNPLKERQTGKLPLNREVKPTCFIFSGDTEVQMLEEQSQATLQTNCEVQSQNGASFVFVKKKVFCLYEPAKSCKPLVCCITLHRTQMVTVGAAAGMQFHMTQFRLQIYRRREEHCVLSVWKCHGHPHIYKLLLVSRTQRFPTS